MVVQSYWSRRVAIVHTSINQRAHNNSELLHEVELKWAWNECEKYHERSRVHMVWQREQSKQDKKERTLLALLYNVSMRASFPLVLRIYVTELQWKSHIERYCFLTDIGPTAFDMSRSSKGECFPLTSSVSHKILLGTGNHLDYSAFENIRRENEIKVVINRKVVEISNPIPSQ